MTAGEDQLEPLVWKGRPLPLPFHCLGRIEQFVLGGERAFAANTIDRAVARGRDKPGAWTGGQSLTRPTLGRDREGFLRDFLGEVEVVQEADERCEDAPPLLAEDALDQRSTTGRTSIAPPMRAAGMRAASAIALSSSGASKKR